MEELTVLMGLMSIPAVSNATWWQCKYDVTCAPSGGKMVIDLMMERITVV